MASSLLQARHARPAWTVEESATFAARRDFELLKLLSTDRKALRVARLLGLPIQPTAAKAAKACADGASKTSGNDSPRAKARPEPTGSKQPRQRPSKKERKLRQALASKLQALVVGFLTRRKELPAAREIAFRRARAEVAERAAAIRENTLDRNASSLAIASPMEIASHGNPKRSADPDPGRRVRPASPLVSAASSYASCEDGDWTPHRTNFFIPAALLMGGRICFRRSGYMSPSGWQRCTYHTIHTPVRTIFDHEPGALALTHPSFLPFLPVCASMCCPVFYCCARPAAASSTVSLLLAFPVVPTVAAYGAFIRVGPPEGPLSLPAA